ncbi:MAG: hypothetical protein NT007_02825 [Candidatus Kapabacteria bacterium]|nr:hypothetical protein [Candidatus Kapabacteria bacterium]
MEIVFSLRAKEEFLKFDNSMKLLFRKSFNKMLENPVRRHLKYGIPYHVENVTKQARIIYELKEDKIIILHCFSEHKEYEKWYNSYK